MECMKCKVLWIEDNENLKGIENEAKYHGIELDRVDNLEDGIYKLRNGFINYSAIILDAYCCIHRGEKIPEDKFLTRASLELSKLFGEKHEQKPWYILSEGTRDGYAERVDDINTTDRQQKEQEWGKIKYSKSLKEDKAELFENILRTAETYVYNKVLSRHSAVFDLIGVGKIIAYDDCRNIMLKMLAALYYPEEEYLFEYDANPVRKVVECLFNTMHKYGLLPEACSNESSQLLECNRYLSGLVTNHSNFRYGEQGESVYGNGDMGQMMRILINYEAEGSHVIKDKVKITEHEKEKFFGFVLMLAHVIRWFGEYIENHKDIEANKQKITKVDVVDDRDSYDGMEMIPEKDENGTFHCGKCVFNVNFWDKVSPVRLSGIQLNTGKNKEKYRYFSTRITNIESSVKS